MNNYINIKNLETVKYENNPFPYCIVDNFFEEKYANYLYENINKLDNNDIYKKWDNNKDYKQNKKFAFHGDGKKLNYEFLNVFDILNSTEFIEIIEKKTGIQNLIKNNTNLRGAGIHRITNGGFLELHTDFNIYEDVNNGFLDRRINILIYLNPDWKDEYNGHLLLVDKDQKKVVKKISPIFNRAVIFNTSSKSIHGHPELLNTPKNIYRQSIANYYYTKNKSKYEKLENKKCFEGHKSHSTIYYNSREFKNVNISNLKK